MQMNDMLRYTWIGLALTVAAACGRGGAADTPATQEVRVEQPAGGDALPPAAVDASEVPAGVSTSDDGVAETGGTGAVQAGGVRPGAGGVAGASPSGAAPAAAAGSAPAPAAGAASDARQILERTERVYAEIRSMEADFVQQLRVPLLDTNQQSRGKLYQRQPDRLLMRFSDPAGDVIVADGRHLWMYYPSVDRTQVLRGTLAQGGGSVDFQREFIHDANTRYAATLQGEETVDGRPTHVIQLIPRTASTYRSVRIWVDRESSLVRRFEVTEQNDSMRRIELRNIRRNAALDDALFRFTVPQGAQVFDQ